MASLPDPLIPWSHHQSFVTNSSGLLGAFDTDVHKLQLETYQSLLTNILPLKRQLLHYLLDLLAVIASKSDLNGATVEHLAKLFAPSIMGNNSNSVINGHYDIPFEIIRSFVENGDQLIIRARAESYETIVLRGSP
jgi:hypothetical protein